MEKTDWQEVKKRLKKAVDQGVKVLKEGSEGARFVAGKTAHVLQLEMDIYGLKNRVAKTTTSLGEAAFRSVKEDTIQMTPEVKKVLADLKTLKASLKRKQSEVSRTHLTQSEKTASKSSKSRKKASK